MSTTTIVAASEPKAPDKVRVYVGMRQANIVIERELHIAPTIDDMVHELNGATVSNFSKLDPRAGYHQLGLQPDSRYITTFTTQMGLGFNISSATMVFQNAICQALQGFSGMKNLSDNDIIVYGASQNEHDDNSTNPGLSSLASCSLQKVFQWIPRRSLQSSMLQTPKLQTIAKVFWAWLTTAPGS